MSGPEGPVQDENPFDDPAHAEDHQLLEGDTTLFLAGNSSLTLGTDSLLVHDNSFIERDVSNCCGILPKRSKDTRSIPYYNILDATVDDLQLTIRHALPLSNTVCRPCQVTYGLNDKTALSSTREWVARLLSHAYGSAQRNKRIKVLVNPFGGQGKAQKIYKVEVEPLFKAAGCEIDVEATTHSGHAREIAAKIDVDKFDVIACASGDGLPHEVFNGLTQQSRPRWALKKIAVVQLPCGSGNAMSLNLNGTDSPSLAALAIIKGLRTPLDLVAVTQGSRKYWSFLSQCVGIVADCDLGTENMRWMGGARFTLGFLVRLLGQTVYPADIAVKVDVEGKSDIREAYRRGREQHESISTKREAEAHEDTSESDVEPLPELRYGTVEDALPSDWHKASLPTLGNFYCGNMTWMSADAPFFPCALPSDNSMDLINIDGAIPRLTALKSLLAVEKNTFFDLPYVEYRKISAYRISPRLRPGQKEGYISIDGEKVPFEEFQAEIVGGLGTVLSRRGGLYEFDGPRSLSGSK